MILKAGSPLPLTTSTRGPYRVEPVASSPSLLALIWWPSQPAAAVAHLTPLQPAAHSHIALPTGMHLQTKKRVSHRYLDPQYNTMYRPCPEQLAVAQLPTRRRKSCVSGPVCVETNVGSPTAGLTDSRSIQNRGPDLSISAWGYFKMPDRFVYEPPGSIK